MLTIEQINDVHARLGSAKRSRNVPALKALGVERHDSFLGVGHSEYFGPEGGGGNYTSSCNYVGSQTGCGVVYRMSRHGSDWIFNILSSFDGANGYNPGQLIRVAPDGSLYTTTVYGGPGDCQYFSPGCGTIFRLQPPATFCRAVSCPWIVDDLYQFQTRADGAFPQAGSLTLDSAGNLFGVTTYGGLVQNCPSGCGVVWKVTLAGLFPLFKWG